MPQASTNSKNGLILTVLGLALVSVGLGLEGQIGMLFQLVAIGFFVAAVVLHVRAGRQGKQPDTGER
jgi:hypothetical protein